MKKIQHTAIVLAAVIATILAGSRELSAQDNHVRFGLAAGVDLPYAFGPGYEYIRPFGDGRIYSLGGNIGLDLYLPIATGFHIRPQLQPYFSRGAGGGDKIVGVRLPVMIGYSFGFDKVVSMPLSLGGYADWYGYDFESKSGFGTFTEALDYGLCAGAGLRFGRIFIDYRFLYSLRGIDTKIAYRDRWHFMTSSFSIGYYF